MCLTQQNKELVSCTHYLLVNFIFAIIRSEKLLHIKFPLIIDNGSLNGCQAEPLIKQNKLI